jgi:vancomycin resistance protein YoaR
MPDTEYFTTFPSKTAKLTLFTSILIAVSCLIACILLLLYFNAKSHLPRNTTIHGVFVGGLTTAEAKLVLEKELPTPPVHRVTLRVDDIAVASDSSELKAKYDIDGAILPLVGVPAAAHTRTKMYTVLKRYYTDHTQDLSISYDPTEANALIAQLQAKVDVPAVPPSLVLKNTGAPATLEVIPGSIGREVDVTESKKLLRQYTSEQDLDLALPVASIGAVLTKEQYPAALERGKKLVGRTVSFTKEGIPFTVTDKQLVSFLQLPAGINSEIISKTTTQWEAQVNRDPQEPVFEYNKETLKVTQFVPPRNGLKLDTEKVTELLTEAISTFESTSDEAVKTVEKPLPLAEKPPNTSLAETNNLGIKERVGFGESYYAHSIPNRIHNVALASQRISLQIIKPGEEFRFNKAIGDVSARTGFKSAYVIQGNKTVLGDGGGVCQVSTTLFRAVLNAGLDVTRRLPHSYCVSYYELDSKPGVDATVYSGETDFRFVNDTNHHILIYGEADSKNLYMYYELYGTSDGRTAEIVDHKTWNPRPAPAPVYIPDPSLPPGKLVQVDWSAPGISASFRNVVKDKNGNVIHDNTYVSNYRPWSAKYMQGVAQ